jgi:hypothetical protein
VDTINELVSALAKNGALKQAFELLLLTASPVQFTALVNKQTRPTVAAASAAVAAAAVESSSDRYAPSGFIAAVIAKLARSQRLKVPPRAGRGQLASPAPAAGLLPPPMLPALDAQSVLEGIKACQYTAENWQRCAARELFKCFSLGSPAHLARVASPAPARVFGITFVNGHDWTAMSARGRAVAVALPVLSEQPTDAATRALLVSTYFRVWEPAAAHAGEGTAPESERDASSPGAAAAAAAAAAGATAPILNHSGAIAQAVSVLRRLYPPSSSQPWLSSALSQRVGPLDALFMLGNLEEPAAVARAQLRPQP